KYTKIESPTGISWLNLGLSSITVKGGGTINNLSAGGIQFSWTADGSNWTDESFSITNEWTKTGLAANTTYQFRARTKSGSPDGIINDWFVGGATSTRIESPIGIVWGDIANTSIYATVAGTFTNLTAGDAGIYISNIGENNSPWKNTTSYWQSTGLTANSEYSFKAKSRNLLTLENAYTGTRSTYTLAQTPSASCDRSSGEWYNTETFTFTNSRSWGIGGVEYYRYVFDQNSTHPTWTDTETQWASGTNPVDATGDGNDWYLHLKSYNAVNRGSGTADYGPYYYDGTASNVPAPVSPVDNYSTINTTITFDWSDVSDPGGSGVGGYLLQVDDDINFGSINYSSSTLAGASQAEIVFTEGDYYWRVRSSDTAGNYSLWSSTSALSINPDANEFLGGSGDGASSVDGLYCNGSWPLYEWTGGTGDGQVQLESSQYRLYVYTILSSLANDTTYFTLRGVVESDFGLPLNSYYFEEQTGNSGGGGAGDSFDTWRSTTSSGLSDITDDTLLSDTSYQWRLTGKDIYGNTKYSNIIDSYTLSLPPDVSCNKSADVWVNVSTFNYTNDAGFGSGGVEYYRIKFSTNNSYTFTDSEPQWSSGVYVGTAIFDKSWYLHTKSFNKSDAANGTTTYGPYKSDVSTPSGLGIAFGNVTDGTIVIEGTASDNSSGLSQAPYWYEETRGNTDGGGLGDGFSAWNSSENVTDTGLSANTQYDYKVEARDNAGNITGWTTDITTYTLAKAPIEPSLTVISSATIDITIQPGNTDNSAVTKYVVKVSSNLGTWVGYMKSDGIFQGTEYWDTKANFGGESGKDINELAVNNLYKFEVKARNEENINTAYGIAITSATKIETVSGLDFTNVSQTAIDARASGSYSNINMNSSGLKIWCQTTSTDTGWKQNNDWWSNADLSINTTYWFKANSKNQDGLENTETSLIPKSTLANAPLQPTLSVVDVDKINILINANSNPEWTQYRIAVSSDSWASRKYVNTNALLVGTTVWAERVDWGGDSGKTVDGLNANTLYKFKVMARNNEDVETANSFEAFKYTKIESPTGISWLNLGLSSITVKGGGTINNLSAGGIQFS
ncbi:MAG: hypothetical protein PF495_18240, partial [Spirochaetales bacterium]|nr:hypothetical protein [Spirochaetales bacterium]